LPTRRVFLYGLPTAALSVYGYTYHIEPRWLEDTQTEIVTGRKLPRPLRILHLSDLHAAAIVPISFLEEAFRRGLAMRPDIVCLTGDFVTTDNDFDPVRYEAALRMLSSACPTFAVAGNHDGGVWAAQSGWFPTSTYIRQMVARGGVRVLHNEATEVEVHGQRFSLVGVGDWWSDELRAPLAFGAVRDPSIPAIVLNHNPDGKADCYRYAWDLMLCGHTHGGQVMVPFYGPPVVPILDKRYAAGLNAFERRWIYTTRGVGNILGFRANCRPEISLLIVR